MDRVKGDTFTFRFTTRAFASGIPTALASGALSAMEDAVDTPITTGVSFTASSVTGLNLCTIDSSQADFEAGKEYDVYVSTGTVGGVSAVGEVVGHFSLSREAAAIDLANGTDGLTALKTGIDAIPTTAMRGTDSAALASVCTEGRLAELDAGNLPTDIAAVPTATENADALLNRDMSAVSDTNARTPLNALRHIRNKWSISGTTLTVTKEDDSTSAWTSTLTEDASANPITGNDPA